MRVIKTKRLELKDLTLDDVDDMFEYAKMPIVGNSAGWTPHKSKDETYQIVKSLINSKEVLGIYLNNKLIGTVGIHYRNGEYDIGYVLHPDYWNKGYMTEACNAVIKDYFENPNNKELFGSTFIDNIGSQRVLQKLGFKFNKDIEKTFKDELTKMKMFRLIKEDFKGE